MQYLIMISYVFMTPFALPASRMYHKSICHSLLFVHHPCIQFLQNLHNTAFAIVFLPQMPHGFLLDSFMMIGPILINVAIFSPD